MNEPLSTSWVNHHLTINSPLVTKHPRRRPHAQGSEVVVREVKAMPHGPKRLGRSMVDGWWLVDASTINILIVNGYMNQWFTWWLMVINLMVNSRWLVVCVGVYLNITRVMARWAKGGGKIWAHWDAPAASLGCPVPLPWRRQVRGWVNEHAPSCASSLVYLATMAHHMLDHVYTHAAMSMSQP